MSGYSLSYVLCNFHILISNLNTNSSRKYSIFSKQTRIQKIFFLFKIPVQEEGNTFLKCNIRIQTFRNSLDIGSQKESFHTKLIPSSKVRTLINYMEKFRKTLSQSTSIVCSQNTTASFRSP